MKIDIGIFAHNEQNNINNIILDISTQDIFSDNDIEIVCHILANGCTDNTSTIAEKEIVEKYIHKNFVVHNLPLGGKSRTWNHFVHNLVRSDSDLVVFADADIRIPESENITKMIAALGDGQIRSVCSSKPVKDINFRQTGKRGVFNRMVGLSANGLDDWSKSVCGSLYVLDAHVARHIYLPIGLPVEDGFIGAIISTDFFDKSNKKIKSINNVDGIFHVYESEKTIFGLIRHQTRIVIGSAINSLIFSELWAIGNRQNVQHFLKENSSNENWVNQLISRKLPNVKFGYIPWHFLFKRPVRWYSSPHRLMPKRIAIMVMGLCFDALVYVRAQIAMARGAGGGYW